MIKIHDPLPGQPMRPVTLTGAPAALRYCERLIQQTITPWHEQPAPSAFVGAVPVPASPQTAHSQPLFLRRAVSDTDARVVGPAPPTPTLALPTSHAAFGDIASSSSGSSLGSPVAGLPSAVASIHTRFGEGVMAPWTNFTAAEFASASHLDPVVVPASPTRVPNTTSLPSGSPVWSSHPGGIEGAGRVCVHLQLSEAEALPVFGRTGSGLRLLRQQSGAQVTTAANAAPAGSWTLTVSGSDDQVQRCQEIVRRMLAQAAVRES